MSAVNIHTEGQLEAVTILGEGETEKEMAYWGLMCFLNTEPLPSGREGK